MADTELDAATAAAIDARSRGDTAAMNQHFDSAKAIAESNYSEDGEPAPSGTASGSRVSAEALDRLREILPPDLTDARLPGFAESGLAYAESFDKQYPAL